MRYLIVLFVGIEQRSSRKPLIFSFCYYIFFFGFYYYLENDIRFSNFDLLKQRNIIVLVLSNRSYENFDRRKHDTIDLSKSQSSPMNMKVTKALLTNSWCLSFLKNKHNTNYDLLLRIFYALVIPIIFGYFLFCSRGRHPD